MNANLQRKLLANQPWLVYVLPLAVFLLVGSLEPKPPLEGTPPTALPILGIVIPYSAYPIIYAVKIGLTALAIALVWPGYRAWPWKVSWLGVLVGVVGGVVWIGLCRLELEAKIGEAIGVQWLIDLGQRSQFNPFRQLAEQPAWTYGFLTLRMVGLVLLVPLIEEFFWRGFVMRFVTHANWWTVPLGDVSRAAIVVGTLGPVLMHPAELMAALVWFSAITWLMLRSGSIWDCVVAHSLTNLVLGVHAIGWSDWRLL